jgi:hypothetical protein
MTPKPAKIFISYSHKDEIFLEQLESHLSMLRRQGLIKPWHDRMITAGDEWKGLIDDNLDSADIVLLLVTANFLASDYCYDIEMMRAIEKHDRREARVIPIIATPVERWRYSPFARLQVLPKDGKAVTQWSYQNEAFVNIAQGIRRAIEIFPDIPITSSVNDQESFIQLERDWSLLNPLGSFQIFIDGLEVGQLANGELARFRVVPGKHTIEVKSGINKGMLVTDVKRNETLQIKASTAAFRINLALIVIEL